MKFGVRLLLFLCCFFSINVVWAIHDVDSIRQELEAYPKEDTVRVRLLNQAAEALFRDQPDEAKKFAEEALQLSESIRDKAGTARSYDMLGKANVALGIFKVALNYHQKALAIYEGLQDQQGIAYSLNASGVACNKLLETDLALDYFLRALKIRLLLGNQLDIAGSYNNIASTYRKIKNFDMSLEMYQKAMDIYVAANEQSRIATTYNNLGLVYMNMKENEKAMEYFQLSINLYEKLGNETGLTRPLNNAGILQKRLGNYDRAISFYNRSLEIKKRTKNKWGISNTMLNMGVVYKTKGDYDKAMEIYDAAMDIAREIDAKDIMINAYKNKALLYVALEDYKTALRHYQIYMNIIRVVLDEEKNKEILRLQAAFEADQQSTKLAYKNDEIKRKNLELKRTNTLRNTLIVAIIVILAFTILLMRTNLQNKRTNQLLQKQTLELAENQRAVELQNEALARKNQELSDAKLSVEQANRAKSDFLSTMSHEIRTPMNAVIGMSNLLLQENPKPEQEENLKILKFSAENLLSLINNILDFSKIESGKIEFEEVSFSPRELVVAIKQALMPKVREKEVSLKVMYDDELPEMVLGDRMKLWQILTNLMNNAVKFTEKGSVLVEVTVLKKEDDLVKLHFSVSDTGVGIPESKLSDIFRSFTQASAETSRKYGGTGLGLAITKGLLELMNSSIHVESKEGFGSRFFFTLELKTSKEAPATPQEKPTAPIDNSLQGIKVLLVEDNKVNQLVAVKFLKKWGISVDIADNGLEALELISDQAYDLILMDLHMPKLNGYDATEAIRKMEEPHLKNIPIVALTASATKEVQERVLRIGMNDYITKPFNPTELYYKIKEYTYRSIKPI